MKAIKIILIPLIIFTVLSCEKYLEERDYGAASTEFYYSTDGMESLINSVYAGLRIYYGQEFGYDFSSPGTDIYDYAVEHPIQTRYTYEPAFDGSNPRLTVLWIEFYKALNATNDAIVILDSPDNPFEGDLATMRLAEVKFLRAHLLYMITEIWGDVGFKTAPTREVITTAYRQPIDTFYAQIFEDLDYAVSNLDEDDNMDDADYARINHWIALAFRSKTALTYASYLRTGFSINGKEYVAQNTALANQYYQIAANDAKAVIASGNYTLWDDVTDLWALSNTNNNQEVVWPINYSRNEYSLINIDGDEYDIYFGAGQKDWAEREGGHHGHLMWGTWYNAHEGFYRSLEYGRGFRRYFPNKYLVDLYVDSLDSRWNLFQTLWFSNEPTSVPTWPLEFEMFNDVPMGTGADNDDSDTILLKVEFELLTGETYIPAQYYVISYADGSTNDTIWEGDYDFYLNPDGTTKTQFQEGDTGILMVKYNVPDNEQALKGQGICHIRKGYYLYDYEGFYDNDGIIKNGPTTWNKHMFYYITKFHDGERDAADGTGSERGIRDDFAIRLAEVYLIAAEADMFLGNMADAVANLNVVRERAALSGKEASMRLTESDLTPAATTGLDVILDERGRELCAEQKRFFDLKRTQTLVERVQTYGGNVQARANIRPYHMLRPIPLAELDAIENAAEFGQNPGY